MVPCLVKYLWGLATMLVLNCAVSMNVIVYVFYSYYVSQFLKHSLIG